MNDGSCDGTRDSVADLPFTTIKPSISRTAYTNDPACRDFIERYDFIFVARQLLNVRNALDEAHARGYSWLVSVDADELICPDPDGLRRGMLAEKLAAMPPEFIQINFPIAEVVQDRPVFADVFAEAENFKIVRDGVTRSCFDPATSEQFPISHIYGHVMGKNAVRVLPEIVPEIHTHGFRSRTGEPLGYDCLGHLMHFHRFDSQNFIDSGRQNAEQPDHWSPGGNSIDRRKRVWRDVVNHQARSDQELCEYFERWLMIPEAEVREWFELDSPAATTITAVSQVFRELRAESCHAG